MKKYKNKNKTQRFTWFYLKPTSTSEDKELPLLLKEIITLELSNPKAPIITQKGTHYFGQNLFLYFFS